MMRVTAVLLLLVPASLAAQTPTIFSCIEPDRLSAGTIEYVVKAGREYKDFWIVAPMEVGALPIVRITFRRTRDAATTSEATTDFNARTFEQVAFRHTRDPNGPEAAAIADLRVHDGRLTGSSYGGDAISVDTNGEPVLFGGVAAEPLAALVDWERCPAVHAQKLKGKELGTVTYTRVGERTLNIGGGDQLVHEVVKKEGEYETRLFVTRSSPFVVVKIESGMGVSELLRISD